MRKHYSNERNEQDEEGSHFSAFVFIALLIGYVVYSVWKYTPGF